MPDAVWVFREGDEKGNVRRALTAFEDTNGELLDQFLERYPGTGSTENDLWGEHGTLTFIKEMELVKGTGQK